MEVLLKDITSENWIECTLLTTNTDGSHTIFEEFVGSNAFSIAQSKIENGWIIKGIYDGTNMVGFTMYGYDYNAKAYELCRFMIDHRYQKKGYGKSALKLVIEEMKNIKDCKEIKLSTNPLNSVAIKLYESFGFKNTGEKVVYHETEDVYCLKL
jgi:diamine N-acetyltransferase